MNLFFLLYGLIISPPSFFASNSYNNRYDDFREEQLNGINTYEIIVPYRLEGRRKRSINTLNQSASHMKEAIFSLEAFGYEYLLEVYLNEVMLPINSTERFYNQNGTPVVRRHRQELNCYYHGSVKDRKNSFVILSTCNGLNGLIRISEKDRFWIEPLYGSNTQHLVYKLEGSKDRGEGFNETAYGSVGESDIVKEYHKSKFRSKRDIYTDTKYTELYIVSDYAHFNRLNRDEDKVIAKFKELANYMDGIYRPLNIRVVLVGVEVWSQHDLITMPTDAHQLLKHFNKWRHEELLPRFPNDIVELISGIDFAGPTVGASTPGSICSSKQSSGVNQDSFSLPKNGWIVAHEIGHTLGMLHDTTGCDCRAPSGYDCLMFPSVPEKLVFPKDKVATLWSRCSRDYLTDTLSKGAGYCLFNTPTVAYGGPICGNELLEEGEECDCGSPQSCNSKCCNPSNCQLLSNATCANGDCCDQELCQFKPGSLTCRESSNECDLPEYCNGQSAICPENVFMQNGETCTQHTNAICYEGMCNTRDEQCKKYFGPGAKEAIPQCYEQLNLEGNIHGNCGYGLNAGVYTYMPCIKDDVYCGTLHCEGGENEPIMGGFSDTQVSFRRDQLGNHHQCKSFSLHVNLDTMDVGLVQSGTKCDNRNVCENKMCLSLSDLDIIPCPKNCSGHGVCNNNNHCHCDAGFAPPLCDTEGNGGSTDSGQPPSPTTTPTENMDENNTALVVTLVMLLAVLPLLFIAMYFLIRNRSRIYNYYCSKRNDWQKASRKASCETTTPKTTSPIGLTTLPTLKTQKAVPPTRPPRPIYTPPPPGGMARSKPEMQPFIPLPEEGASFNNQFGVQLRPVSQHGRPASSAALPQKSSPPLRPPLPLHKPSNPPLPSRPTRPQSIPGQSTTQPFRPAPPPPAAAARNYFNSGDDDNQQYC